MVGTDNHRYYKKILFDVTLYMPNFMLVDVLVIEILEFGRK